LRGGRGACIGRRPRRAAKGRGERSTGAGGRASLDEFFCQTLQGGRRKGRAGGSGARRPRYRSQFSIKYPSHTPCPTSSHGSHCLHSNGPRRGNFHPYLRGRATSCSQRGGSRSITLKRWLWHCKRPRCAALRHLARREQSTTPRRRGSAGELPGGRMSPLRDLIRSKRAGEVAPTRNLHIRGEGKTNQCRPCVGEYGMPPATLGSPGDVGIIKIMV